MKPDVTHILKLNAEAAKKASGNFYRVSHGGATELPGVILDRLGDVFVLRTNTQEADVLVGELKEKLAGDFQAKAILLKNSHATRHKNSLPLTDAVIFGGSDMNEIQVPENLFFYRYDLNSTELFSFELADLRKKLGENLPHDAVILGCDENAVIPIGHTLNNICVVSGESFTEQTEFLRRENSGLKPTFSTAIIVMRQRFFTKHQKSIFHLFYQLVKMLGDKPTIYLCARQPKPYVDVMKMVVKKCSVEVKMVACLMG